VYNERDKKVGRK
jgi:hypothetical protein